MASPSATRLGARRSSGVCAAPGSRRRSVIAFLAASHDLSRVEAVAVGIVRLPLPRCHTRAHVPLPGHRIDPSCTERAAHDAIEELTQRAQETREHRCYCTAFRGPLLLVRLLRKTAPTLVGPSGGPPTRQPRWGASGGAPDAAAALGCQGEQIPQIREMYAWADLEGIAKRRAFWRAGQSQVFLDVPEYPTHGTRGDDYPERRDHHWRRP